MAELRALTCIDCGVLFEHFQRTARPLRCTDCNKAMHRARTREWYQQNRQHALRYARERHLASRPSQVSLICSRCGVSFVVAMNRGVQKRLFCDECQDVRARERNRLHKARNREQLRTHEREVARRKYAEDPEYRSREREKSQRYREANPDKVKASRRKSYFKHQEARRARRRDHYIRDRLAIFNRDKGICHICARPVPANQFEIDHIIPVSRGGSSAESNLATAHFACNRHKAAKLIAELVA